MGFNGYNDGVNRTAFNPMAWGGSIAKQEERWRMPEVPVANGIVDTASDQNRARIALWAHLYEEERALADAISPQYSSVFFELVGYPVEGAVAMNNKFLATDQTFVDAHERRDVAMVADAARAKVAYDTIQTLTAKYNSLENGKWDGIMSAAPRERHVFEMPRTATEADAKTPLPASWGADDSPAIAHPAVVNGFHEEHATVSINAAHFTRKSDGVEAKWNVLKDLGISGDSMVYGAPGLLANSDVATATSGPQAAPALEYDFTTTTSDKPATLALHLLPTFAVDSDHRLRYAVALDGGVPVEMDLTPPATVRKAAGAGDGPSDSGWAENVLRNSAVAKIPLGTLAPRKHTLRLLYRDPGVVFEHIVVTFPGAPPAYPVPPETK